MPAVARQVALHIFVANADLRRLVALSDDMEPPVAVAIPAKVAPGRLLSSVTWMDALNYISKSKGLHYSINGDVIYVSAQKDFF